MLDEPEQPETPAPRPTEPQPPVITASDLEHWFPHVQKMSNGELAFLAQGLGTIGVEARKRGLAFVDDFISRWLMVFEAVMHDRGYENFRALQAAMDAERHRAMPTAKLASGGTVN